MDLHDLQLLAEKLRVARQSVATQEDIIKAIKAPEEERLAELRQNRDAIQGDLKLAMQKSGVKTVKDAFGSSIILVDDHTTKVANETELLWWLKEHGYLAMIKETIVMSEVNKRAQELIDAGAPGLSIEPTQYISLRKGKE